MKSTISALLIPFIGICTLTLAACSGPERVAGPGPFDPNHCAGVSSVVIQRQATVCPK